MDGGGEVLGLALPKGTGKLKRKDEKKKKDKKAKKKAKERALASPPARMVEGGEIHAGSEERLAMAVRATNVCIWEVDLRTDTIYRSPEWFDITGYRPGEMATDAGAFQQLYDAETFKAIREARDAHIRGESPEFRLEHRIRTKGGEWRWVDARGQVVEWDAEGKPVRLLGTALDITDRRRAIDELTLSEAKHRFILDAVPFPLLITRHSDETVLFLNQHASRYLGVTAKEVINRPMPSYFHDPADQRRLWEMVEAHGEIMNFAGTEPLSVMSLGGRQTTLLKPEAIEAVAADAPLSALAGVFREYGRVTGFEVRLKDRRGQPIWALISAVLMDFAGDRALYVAFNDISKIKSLEGELKRLATTDPLTGVLNRRSFMDACIREAQRAKRYSLPLSVLQFDIDFFKKVNDTYGHHIGDEAIKAMARVCTESLRETDVFGRLGGEEFAAILPQTDINGAREIAERVRIKAMGVVVPADEGREVRFTCSIGASQYRVTDESLDTTLQRADEGLYEAKRGGRNKVVCV